jgi:hypothetical protein
VLTSVRGVPCNDRGVAEVAHLIPAMALGAL